MRWLHVAEAADVAVMLTGGEMVLKPGLLLAGDERAQTEYPESMQRADAVAVMLGLGRALRTTPEPMRRAAERCGAPLIVLHRPAPFDRLTEEVHSRLIHGRFAALKLSDRMRSSLTALNLSGAPWQSRRRAAPVLLRPVGPRDHRDAQILHAPTRLLRWPHRLGVRAIVVVVVDLAQHWLKPMRAGHPQTTGHDCASIVIGRRAQGRSARRRTPPPPYHQSDGAGHRSVQARPDALGCEETRRKPAHLGPDHPHDGCHRQVRERGATSASKTVRDARTEPGHLLL
ncbi:MAG: PucR family transcriptional regulator, partial [Streptomyces oryziradicis]|nr:PucR family transcriptional regulator [Actinacidiphila oryziradicis]